ncbi:MAG: DHA2 family efflux MFS transporter permease subunit [Pseudomonadota bacterium]|nr:DHA2 family efflux MFS transporter permease subunit [Pseudomonadota bacterium]
MSDVLDNSSRSISFFQWMILGTLTLTSTLYAMSITIANIALPQLQGALGATQDQIAWTVTFNIVGTAIVTPMTGWLTLRFGQRRLMLCTIFGFAISSILCGQATTLAELVIYRVLQGAFGGPLVPLSQAIILGVFPRRLHSFSTAVWGMGVVCGPIIGPTVGGYISEAYSWRWIFYIIAPFSLLAFIGSWVYVKNTVHDKLSKLDWTGFISLSIAVTALQLMLDRGNRLDWFDSREILVEAAVAIIFFYIFTAHILTSRNPYLNPWLLKDRNYFLGFFLVFIYGMLNFTPIVLYPSMLQDLRGYPESIIGLLLAARGFGAFAGNFLVLVISRRDPRIGLALGFIAQAGSCWLLANFDINMTTAGVAWASAIQGFGVGLSWVPLTIVMFSNIDPKFVPEGTAVLHLLRNIGSSIYISLTITIVIRSTSTNYADFTNFINPFNEIFLYRGEMGFWNSETFFDLKNLSSEIERQSAMIGYINAFYFLAVTGFLALPLILFVKTPKKVKKVN